MRMPDKIQAVSPEEHETIHRGTELVASLSKKWFGDITAALKALKEYEESELRPADKFLTNTLDKQMQHIEQEFFEVCDALYKYQALRKTPNTPAHMLQCKWHNIIEELTDLKTSCETMLAIMGLDAADRRAEVRKVNAKNERRNYFDRTE